MSIAAVGLGDAPSDNGRIHKDTEVSSSLKTMGVKPLNNFCHLHPEGLVFRQAEHPQLPLTWFGARRAQHL